MRRVHLDTWAFMAVLLENKYADILKDIMRRSGPGSYPLVASQAALGEADAVILRRGKDAARMPSCFSRCSSTTGSILAGACRPLTTPCLQSSTS